MEPTAERTAMAIEGLGDTTWATLHTVGWASYVGGAMVMELVWRPAQTHLPQSQIAVACQRMGRRYRWLATAALGLVGMTGVAQVAMRSEPFDASSARGRIVLALGLCWLALAALLAVITFSAHPALHVRTPSALPEDERAAAREQVQRAIHRMDVLLRVDLAIALLAALLGSALEAGGPR